MSSGLPPMPEPFLSPVLVIDFGDHTTGRGPRKAWDLIKDRKKSHSIQTKFVDLVRSDQCRAMAKAARTLPTARSTGSVLQTERLAASLEAMDAHQARLAAATRAEFTVARTQAAACGHPIAADTVEDWMEALPAGLCAFVRRRAAATARHVHLPPTGAVTAP